MKEKPDYVKIHEALEQVKAVGWAVLRLENVTIHLSAQKELDGTKH